MSTLRSPLDRLEQTNSPKAWGRFITVRASRCEDARATRYLVDQGMRFGSRDLVLLETHSDPGAALPVAPSEPISPEIIECTERFEYLLARLEEET